MLWWCAGVSQQLHAAGVDSATQRGKHLLRQAHLQQGRQRESFTAFNIPNLIFLPRLQTFLIKHTSSPDNSFLCSSCQWNIVLFFSIQSCLCLSLLKYHMFLIAFAGKKSVVLSEDLFLIGFCCVVTCVLLCTCRRECSGDLVTLSCCVVLSGN
jgi:hypothetical protein